MSDETLCSIDDACKVLDDTRQMQSMHKVLKRLQRAMNRRALFWQHVPISEEKLEMIRTFDPQQPNPPAEMDGIEVEEIQECLRELGVSSDVIENGMLADLLTVYDTPSADAEIFHKQLIDDLIKESDLHTYVSLVDCCQYAPTGYLPAQAALAARAEMSGAHSEMRGFELPETATRARSSRGASSPSSSSRGASQATGSSPSRRRQSSGAASSHSSSSRGASQATGSSPSRRRQSSGAASSPSSSSRGASQATGSSPSRRRQSSGAASSPSSSSRGASQATGSSPSRRRQSSGAASSHSSSSRGASQATGSSPSRRRQSSGAASSHSSSSRGASQATGSSPSRRRQSSGAASSHSSSSRGASQATGSSLDQMSQPETESGPLQHLSSPLDFLAGMCLGFAPLPAVRRQGSRAAARKKVAVKESRTSSQPVTPSASRGLSSSASPRRSMDSTIPDQPAIYRAFKSAPGSRNVPLSCHSDSAFDLDGFTVLGAVADLNGSSADETSNHFLPHTLASPLGLDGSDHALLDWITDGVLGVHDSDSLLPSYTSLSQSPSTGVVVRAPHAQRPPAGGSMRISWTAFLDDGDDVFKDQQTAMLWAERRCDQEQIDSLRSKVTDLQQKCPNGLGGSSIRVLAAGALSDVTKYSKLIEQECTRQFHRDVDKAAREGWASVVPHSGTLWSRAVSTQAENANDQSSKLPTLRILRGLAADIHVQLFDVGAATVSILVPSGLLDLCRDLIDSFEPPSQSLQQTLDTEGVVEMSMHEGFWTQGSHVDVIRSCVLYVFGCGLTAAASRLDWLGPELVVRVQRGGGQAGGYHSSLAHAGSGPGPQTSRFWPGSHTLHRSPSRLLSCAFHWVRWLGYPAVDQLSDSDSDSDEAQQNEGVGISGGAAAQSDSDDTDVDVDEDDDFAKQRGVENDEAQHSSSYEWSLSHDSLLDHLHLVSHYNCFLMILLMRQIARCSVFYAQRVGCKACNPMSLLQQAAQGQLRKAHEDLAAQQAEEERAREIAMDESDEEFARGRRGEWFGPTGDGKRSASGATNRKVSRKTLTRSAREQLYRGAARAPAWTGRHQRRGMRDLAAIIHPYGQLWPQQDADMAMYCSFGVGFEVCGERSVSVAVPNPATVQYMHSCRDQLLRGVIHGTRLEHARYAVMQERIRPYAALASVGEYAGTFQGMLPATLSWGDVLSVHRRVLAENDTGNDYGMPSFMSLGCMLSSQLHLYQPGAFRAFQPSPGAHDSAYDQFRRRVLSKVRHFAESDAHAPSTLSSRTASMIRAQAALDALPTRRRIYLGLQTAFTQSYARLTAGILGSTRGEFDVPASTMSLMLASVVLPAELQYGQLRSEHRADTIEHLSVAPFSQCFVEVVKKTSIMNHLEMLRYTLRRALCRIERLLVAAVCGADRIPTYQRSAMWALAASMSRCCMEGCVALRTDAWSQVVAEQIAVTWLPATRPVLRNLGPSTLEWSSVRDCLQSASSMPEQSNVMAVASAIIDQIGNAVQSVRAGGCNGTFLNSWTVLAVCEVMVTSWSLCALAEGLGMTWQISRISERYGLSGLVSTQGDEHFQLGISGVNNGITGFRAMVRADVQADILSRLPERSRLLLHFAKSTDMSHAVVMEQQLRKLYLAQMHLAKLHLRSGTRKGMLARGSLAVALYGLLLSRLRCSRSAILVGLQMCISKIAFSPRPDAGAMWRGSKNAGNLRGDLATTTSARASKLGYALITSLSWTMQRKLAAESSVRTSYVASILRAVVGTRQNGQPSLADEQFRRMVSVWLLPACVIGSAVLLPDRLQRPPLPGTKRPRGGQPSIARSGLQTVLDVSPPPRTAQPAVTIAQHVESVVLDHFKWMNPGFDCPQVFRGALNRQDGSLRRVIDVGYYGAGLCINLPCSPSVVPALSEAPYYKAAGKGLVRRSLAQSLKAVGDVRSMVARARAEAGEAGVSADQRHELWRAYHIPQSQHCSQVLRMYTRARPLDDGDSILSQASTTTSALEHSLDSLGHIWPGHESDEEEGQQKRSRHMRQSGEHASSSPAERTEANAFNRTAIGSRASEPLRPASESASSGAGSDDDPIGRLLQMPTDKAGSDGLAELQPPLGAASSAITQPPTSALSRPRGIRGDQNMAPSVPGAGLRGMGQRDISRARGEIEILLLGTAPRWVHIPAIEQEGWGFDEKWT